MLKVLWVVILVNIGECVLVELVVIGIIIVIRLGEFIFLDGEVIIGWVVVDESMVFGEFVFVEKIVGFKVFSGMIN